MNKISLTRNKIISIALAVIVLIMLFLSWAGVTGQTKKAWVFVQNIIDDYASDIEQYVDAANSMGLNIDTKAVKRVARSLSNGRISPFEAFTSAGTARKIINKLGAVSYFNMDQFKTVVSLCTLYRVFFVLLFISVLLSIYVRLTGKLRSLDILMFVFTLILFIGFAVAASKINGLGVQAGITAWSVIALICSVPVILLDKIPFLKTSDGEVKLPVIKAGEGSSGATVIKNAGATMTAIGASLSGLKDKAGVLIKNIGAGRKVTYQCSVCGHDLQSSDKVCPACRSSAEDKMSTAVCRNCGCRIPSGSKYCPICGVRQD